VRFTCGIDREEAFWDEYKKLEARKKTDLKAFGPDWATRQRL
jgi:hypothetical protein